MWHLKTTVEHTCQGVIDDKAKTGTLVQLDLWVKYSTTIIPGLTGHSLCIYHEHFFENFSLLKNMCFGNNYDLYQETQESRTDSKKNPSDDRDNWLRWWYSCFIHLSLIKSVIDFDIRYSTVIQFRFLFILSHNAGISTFCYYVNIEWENNLRWYWSSK